MGFTDSIMPTRQKALFLDRDGTIIEDRGYLNTPDQVVFIRGAVEALRSLQKAYRLFIVTNQSGVAKGLITMQNVATVNGHVVNTLSQEGVAVTGVYVCPHQRSDDCFCMKPNPHFLHLAARRYGLDIAGSHVIGDHPHDCELADNAGANGLYVLTGHGQKHLPGLKAGTPVVRDIGEAAAWILKRGNKSRVKKAFE